MFKGLLSIALILAALVTALAWRATIATVDGAQVRAPRSGQFVQVTLKTQLEKGLKARRPVEFAFIREIVRLVERERLTVQEVDSAYQWATWQGRFMVQYFEGAIRAIADKRGVNIKITTL